MKTNLTVQFMGKEVLTADIEKAVKDDMKAKGLKQTAIATLNIYYKPEENRCFYVTRDKNNVESAFEISL